MSTKEELVKRVVEWRKALREEAKDVVNMTKKCWEADGMFEEILAHIPTTTDRKWEKVEK